MCRKGCVEPARRQQAGSRNPPYRCRWIALNFATQPQCPSPPLPLSICPSFPPIWRQRSGRERKITIMSPPGARFSRSLQGWPKKCVLLGGVISPLRQQAESCNLHRTNLFGQLCIEGQHKRRWSQTWGRTGVLGFGALSRALTRYVVTSTVSSFIMESAVLVVA